MENTTAQRIRKIRLEKNLSQGELGEMINVTSDQISRIERGVSKPRLSTIKLIAEGLGVEVSSLTVPMNEEVSRDEVRLISFNLLYCLLIGLLSFTLGLILLASANGWGALTRGMLLLFGALAIFYYAGYQRSKSDVSFPKSLTQSSVGVAFLWLAVVVAPFTDTLGGSCFVLISLLVSMCALLLHAVRSGISIFTVPKKIN